MSNTTQFERTKVEDSDGVDCLVGESLVLFFDILGVSALFSGRDANETIQNVGTLYLTLDAIRGNLGISRRNGVTVPDTLAAAMFSDSMYLVSAIGTKPTDFEGELYGQFFKVSECQTILLKHGFIARGGIAKGLVAVENNFIAGPACVEASTFEKSGMPPVIMVDKQLLWDSYWGSCNMKCSAPNPDFFLLDESWRYKLLYDTNTDVFFFNYMEDWFSLCSDPLSEGDPKCYQQLAHNLELQKDLIVRRLSEFSTQPEVQSNILEKYCFLANFHNFVLRAYANVSEFANVTRYVISPPPILPPTSIAWAEPYLKKFLLEESYKRGHQNVDEAFVSHTP